MKRRKREVKPQLYKREIHIPVGEAATFGAENKIYGGRSVPSTETDVAFTGTFLVFVS